MTSYNVGDFLYQFGREPYQALAKLKKYPGLVPQILQSAPNDLIKQCIQNMDYILLHGELKNATFQQIVGAIQNIDIKNVNTGFGDEEDWQQKYNTLEQEYKRLQMLYNNKVIECEEINNKYAELEIEKYRLEEELNLRSEENRELGDQIEGYINTANKTLEGVQAMTIKGNNTINNLQMQITQLKMENEQLKNQLNKIERNVKVEEMKRKVHEDTKKNFEPSSASKMYNAGAKKTMSLLQQFQQQRQSNMIGGGTIPMIRGSIPMSGSIQGEAIPMSAPSGIRSQNDLKEPILGRGNGPIIEEMEDEQKFMIKISDFNIIFKFDPTTMTPEKIMEGFLPMLNNNFRVNDTILVIPNKQQQPVDILVFMQNPEKFKSIFHNWYINFVGNNYERIGGQRQEIINMYKYILSEIVRQGKQAEFGHALGY